MGSVRSSCRRFSSGATFPRPRGETPPRSFPGVLFERFADRRALAEHYPHMRAWADVLVGLAGDRMLWEGGFQFGDWLDPDAPPEQAEAAKTDPDIVASAYFFAATRAVARAADELGIADDAHHYATLAEEARQAWIREYTTKGEP